MRCLVVETVSLMKAPYHTAAQAVLVSVDPPSDTDYKRDGAVESAKSGLV